MVPPLPSAVYRYPVRSEHSMEDYFRQFLGAQVVSIVQPEDKWSSLFVFQLMKNGVQSSFTLVGGSCGATPPFCAEVREGLLYASFCPNEKDGVTLFLVAEMEVEDVRGFFHGGTHYWSAVVRITITAGIQKLLFGDLESNLCIGVWPLEQPLMLGSSVSLHMQFMRDYLNLLEDLPVSAVEYSPTGKLVVRILRSDCVSTVTEEILVLDMDKARPCACIYEDEKCYYVDQPNLVRLMMNGCNKGALFVDSFKTTKLQGSLGRCPGQMLCVCYPLPQIWTATVEITLKWGLRRIKIGQIPVRHKGDFSEIGAMGLWPGTVPFFHGIV